MTDEIIDHTTLDAHEANRKMLKAQFKKIITLLILLCAGWVLFAYILPPLIFPQPNTNTVQAVQPRVSAEKLSASEQAAANSFEEETTPPEVSAQEPSAIAHSATTSENPLEARIASLEEEVRQLKEQLQSPAASAQTADTLKDVQDKLQEQAQKTDSLQEELGNKQQAAYQATLIWQTYDAFAEEVRSGDAFAESLIRFSSLTANNVEVQRNLEELRAYADSGVASLEFLQDNFEDVIPDALHTSADPGEESSMKDKVVFNLSSLVRIRKVGKPEGNTADAIIARAETAVKDGEIAQAIAEIQKLPENQLPAFSAWIDHAKGYITRSKALPNIRRALLTQTELNTQGKAP